MARFRASSASPLKRRPSYAVRAAPANASKHPFVLCEEGRSPADDPDVRAARHVELKRRLLTGGAQPTCSTSSHSPLPRFRTRSDTDSMANVSRARAKHLGQRFRPVELGPGERRHRLGLGPGSFRGPCPPDRELDRAADDHRHRHEHDEGDCLIRVGDGQRVDRVDEEVVDQEDAREGGNDADDDSADDRDRDDGQQIDQDLTVESEPVTERVEAECQQGQQQNRQR